MMILLQLLCVYLLTTYSFKITSDNYLMTMSTLHTYMAAFTTSALELSNGHCTMTHNNDTLILPHNF